MKFNNRLAHYGDILAIPFFILSLYYFWQIPQRTLIETVLLLFSFIGLSADILFTYLFTYS